MKFASQSAWLVACAEEIQRMNWIYKEEKTRKWRRRALKVWKKGFFILQYWNVTSMCAGPIKSNPLLWSVTDAARLIPIQGCLTWWVNETTWFNAVWRVNETIWFITPTRSNAHFEAIRYDGLSLAKEQWGSLRWASGGHERPTYIWTVGTMWIYNLLSYITALGHLSHTADLFSIVSLQVNSINWMCLCRIY